MRIVLFHRSLLALLIAALSAGPAVSEEEKTPPRTKRRPIATQPASPQTQTAPGAAQTRPQTAPGEAGVHTVQGWVVQVNPERKSVVIRATTNQYEIFITPRTQVTRDGQPVNIGKIQPLDRVDACQFNAKRVSQKLTLTSGEKAGTAPKRERP